MLPTQLLAVISGRACVSDRYMYSCTLYTVHCTLPFMVSDLKGKTMCVSARVCVCVCGCVGVYVCVCVCHLALGYQ